MSLPDRLDSNDGLDAIQRLVEGLTFLEQPSSADWERAESELGVSLPLHYKSLLSMLGSGHCGEISLMNPASSSEIKRLSRSELQGFYDRVSDVARESSISLYPECGGYLRIGIAGNGMDLLLLPESVPHILANLVWWKKNDCVAFPLNMTVSRFLSDLYLGSLSAPWSEEVKELIWEPGEDFFSPRLGRQPGVLTDKWDEILEKGWPPRWDPDV